MADGKIEYQVRADTSHVNEDMEGVSSTLESSGSKWTSIVGGAMASIGSSLAGMAVQAAQEAYKLGTAFEDGMAKVSTLMDTSVVDMGKVGDGLLRLSSQFGLGANDMAAAAYNAVSSYTKFATDSEGLMQVLSKSATLAKAGFTDIDTAASATLGTLNAYGLGIEHVDMVQKVLLQTQNNGVVQVGELGRVLANVTPTAAAMGVSFEQVGAAMATMTAQSTPAASATTQLNSMFAELGKSGTTASKALAQATQGTQYAGKGFKQLMDSGVPLNNILQIMRDYAESNGKSLLDMFSSVEAGKGALTLTGQGAAMFTENLSAMRTQADVVTEAFEKVAGTSSERVQQMLTTLQNLLIQVFAAVEPLVSAVLNLASAVLPVVADAFGVVIEAIKPVIEWLTNLVNNIREGLGPTMTAIFDGFKSTVENVFGAVGSALETLKGAWESTCTFLGAAMETAKSGITTAWEGIKSGFQQAGDWISTTFKSAWQSTCTALSTAVDTAKSGIGTAWEGIKGAFSTAGDWMSSTFGPAWDNTVKGLQNTFDGFKQAMGPAWDAIKALFQTFSDFYQNTFANAWKAVTSLLTGDFETFKTSLGNIWEGIKSFFSGVLGWLDSTFAAPFKGIWEGLSSHFGGVFEGLKSKFTGPINWIIDKLNSFIDGINAVKIPDWVPAVGGMGFSIPHLPRLKVGMDYVPSDNFPALLHKGEAVLTAAEATEWRGGQGRGASGADAEAIAAALAAQLKNLVIPIYLDGREVGRGVEPYVSSSMADRYNSQQRSGYSG